MREGNAHAWTCVWKIRKVIDCYTHIALQCHHIEAIPDISLG
ncbi:hypothetical protein SAMN05660479_02607 [Microbulbifer thermotolerans]|nr:hypothetical protein SAMN05660479_02607 [Microbulbifer thermotolerans]